MSRNTKRLSLALAVCSVIAVLSVSSVFADDQYSVTVDNDGANRSTDIILERHNVGANFSEQNTLVFRNMSSYNIRIDVESLESLADTGLLQYATFSVSGENGAVSGRYPEVSGQNLACVQSGSSDDLVLQTNVDRDLNNAHQGAMFKVKATFYMQAVEEDCKTEIPDEEIRAPGTGIGNLRRRLLFIGGTLVIIGIIFLLPMRQNESKTKIKKVTGKSHENRTIR